MRKGVPIVRDGACAYGDGEDQGLREDWVSVKVRIRVTLGSGLG